MRIIVFFIVLILIGAGAYTAYGIFTFEPEKPAPLVFKEPTPESLRSLGILPPDDSNGAGAMTPAQADQTKKAVALISQAIGTYQQYGDQAGMRLKDTLMTLTAAMGSGQLPAYFLSVTDAVRPKRQFEMLKFDPTATQEAGQGQTSVTCATATSVLLGNDGDDALACTSPGTNGDQIFVGGPGNDTISDSLGNRIVNGGSGDDTITLGPGRSIIVLDENWGKDTLTADCKGATVEANEIPPNFAVPWISKFTNFIVLSPRISKESVHWNGKVLTNAQTGDTLTVNENCFTLISAQSSTKTPAKLAVNPPAK